MIGLQLPNVTTPPSPEDISIINVLKPSWVRCLGNIHPDYLRALPSFTIAVVRDNSGGQLDPYKVVRDVRPAITVLGETRVVINLGNEPNEAQGHYDRFGGVSMAAADLKTVADAVRREYPNVPRCSPNIAVIKDADRYPNIHDKAWIGHPAWKSAVLYGCDYVGVNAYGAEDYAYQLWQYVSHSYSPKRGYLVLEAGDPGMTVQGALNMAQELYSKTTQLRGIMLFGAMPGFTDDWNKWKKDESWFRALVAKPPVYTPPPPPSVTPVVHDVIKNIIDRRPLFNGTYSPRPGGLKSIKRIIVHHSATPDERSAESIREYHVDTLGWPGIAYHYGVYSDRIEHWGDISLLRWHDANENYDSIGICLPGNFSAKHPTNEQIYRAKHLIAYLRELLGWRVPYEGHVDMPLPQDDTYCPGLTWKQWRDKLESTTLPTPSPSPFDFVFGFKTLWESRGGVDLPLENERSWDWEVGRGRAVQRVLLGGRGPGLYFVVQGEEPVVYYKKV